MYVVPSSQLNVNVGDCSDRVRGGNGSESKPCVLEWLFVSPPGVLGCFNLSSTIAYPTSTGTSWDLQKSRQPQPPT